MLKGASPEQVVQRRLAAEPKLANRRYKPPDSDALPPALQVVADAKEVSHPDTSTTVAPFVCDVRFAPSLDARGARWTRRSRKQVRPFADASVWRRGGFLGQTSIPTLQPGFVATFLG